MDGAVGFTQCAIPAGHDFIYDFTIGNNEHGTFWWHSHTSLQRGDGLYGGLIIHEPNSLSEGREALLLVSDWYHRNQTEVYKTFRHRSSLGQEPVPDSILVNGRGRYNCPMAIPVHHPVQCNQVEAQDMLPLFQLKPSKRTKLRVVHVGTLAGFTFSIDDATLQPVAVDAGGRVDAEPGHSVGILYPGERVDVMTEWNGGDSAEKSRMNIYLDNEYVVQFLCQVKIPFLINLLQKLARRSKSGSEP